jgi:hypothetical protein
MVTGGTSAFEGLSVGVANMLAAGASMVLAPLAVAPNSPQAVKVKRTSIENIKIDWWFNLAFTLHLLEHILFIYSYIVQSKMVRDWGNERAYALSKPQFSAHPISGFIKGEYKTPYKS